MKAAIAFALLIPLSGWEPSIASVHAAPFASVALNTTRYASSQAKYVVPKTTKRYDSEHVRNISGAVLSKKLNSISTAGPADGHNTHKELWRKMLRRKIFRSRVRNIKNWRRMGIIEKRLSQNKPVRLLRRSADLREWLILRREMRRQWKREKCWTGFNPVMDQWVSCCLVESLTRKRSIGFCGSHEALHLPNLCRAPKKGLDFTKTQGFKVRKVPKPKGLFNTGRWDCPGVQRVDTKPNDIEIISKTHRPKGLESDKDTLKSVKTNEMLVQRFDILYEHGLDEEQFVVYHPDDINGQNPCSHVVNIFGYFSMPCFASWYVSVHFSQRLSPMPVLLYEYTKIWTNPHYFFEFFKTIRANQTGFLCITPTSGNIKVATMQSWGRPPFVTPPPIIVFRVQSGYW